MGLTGKNMSDKLKDNDNPFHLEGDEEVYFISNNYLKKQIEEQCQHAKADNTSFALMFLSINKVERVNHILNHRLADELIIKISQRLRNYLGDGKFIWCLGCKFAVMVSGIGTVKKYDEMAKEIVGLFTRPFKVGTYELYVTVNMGISVYPEDGQNSDALVECAHLALLCAKDADNSKYSFYSYAMDFGGYKQLILLKDIKDAIGEDQIKVHFQPIVNLKILEVLGAEAMVCWEHPSLGIMMPDEFMPLAERTGFITTLANWMLQQVCRAYKGWINRGLPAVKVTINYSNMSFLEQGFIQNIKKITDRVGLSPDFLIVEITEDILIQYPETAASRIKDLHALGIQVAVKGFGTGVSSMAYLSTFNIDILKLDRLFVRNICSDNTGSIITQHTINLARELRIKLVAEGIESWDQLSHLRKLNCYAGQGYLYGKPVIKEAFKKVLARKRCKPVRTNDSKFDRKQRREYFRIRFIQLLEADMTVLRNHGKATDTGCTKAVIRDIGLGGLRFDSDIKIPVKRDLILQFKTELLGKSITLYGCPVWMEEISKGIYEYGIQFTIGENERTALARLLNQVQIRMRNNINFADGRFISGSPERYFKIRNS